MISLGGADCGDGQINQVDEVTATKWAKSMTYTVFLGVWEVDYCKATLEDGADMQQRESDAALRSAQGVSSGYSLWEFCWRSCRDW